MGTWFSGGLSAGLTAGLDDVVWHTSSPWGGVLMGHRRLRLGRGSCKAFAWAIASPRRSQQPAGSKQAAFKCPDLHGCREAKTPLRSKQEEQEAPRSLLKAAGAAAALLHSPSHHQSAITAHICSLVWASAASWLRLTSVFSLDWCRVKNELFFQLISLL